MFAFVLFYVYLNSFRFVENRNCSGVHGWECCNGYALNTLTGKCEKCPIGYHRKNCSEKCSYPTYGADCQTVCNCHSDDCHFVSGCYQYGGPVTKITANFATSSTVILSNVTVLYQTVYSDFSVNSKNLRSTTLTYLLPTNDLFKNNFVAHVILGLIGVFVFFFAIFVLTYIYFKCFRKKTYRSRMEGNEWQAQYKSLRFDAVEPEITIHPEPQRHVNPDSAYLSPVFSQNERNELHGLVENMSRHENEDISQETQLHGLRNVPIVMQDNVPDHVYIEITEDNVEKSNFDVEPGREKQEIINFDRKASSSRESTYINDNNFNS